MEILLTKSKYLLGLQCLKDLWILFNEPDKVPKIDETARNRMEEGEKVGELAKKRFPEGVDISTENFTENLEKTRNLLAERKVLFEPGFKVGELYARADILKPVNGNEWDIIEVKSSTRVKEINLHDVSFQKYCLEKSGLKIRKCYLMVVNNKFIKQGEIDPVQFFSMEDVTEKVEPLVPGVEKNTGEMIKAISSKECPDIQIGHHCNQPYECKMKYHCWDFLPGGHVFQLSSGGNKTIELFENGVHSLSDIPDDFKLTVKQGIQKECSKTGKPHINKDNIRKFLKSLKYDLYFLDFETFSTAIPIFDGTKPYQQIPFQFSLHVVDKDSNKTHHSYLEMEAKDPRPEFAEELKKVLGQRGNIIVYNQAFEIGRLKELAGAFPEYGGWVDSVLERTVDLLVPFRNFDYYNPVQEGSASIKKVLPALTGNGYSELEISNGDEASQKYFEVTFQEPNSGDKEKVRKDLEKYCSLDTEGMVQIVEELGKIVKTNFGDF